MPIYLSVKEIWRNKGRFLLFSLVIALITVLVLFIAGLAEGLASANREYLAKIEAELLVFQENSDLSTTSSRLGRSILNDIRRVPGVAEVGPVGLSSSKLVLPNGEDLDIALIGVEAGLPGSPSIFEGQGLRSTRGSEAVLDGVLAAENNLQVGDEIIVRSVQGTEARFLAADRGPDRRAPVLLPAPGLLAPAHLGPDAAAGRAGHWPGRVDR